MIHVEVTCNGERRVISYPMTPAELGISMDELQKIIGDGKANVNASMSFSDKDYGNGFEVRVGVSLTCNQDQSTISKARELVLELLVEHLEQGKTAAEATYGALIR